MTRYLDGPRPRVFAHRGWHSGALSGLENSMAAFGAAVDAGIRYLETDVHATADGKLIAFHDQRLDRVTDATGVVSELTWPQLQRARIGGREPIPLFDEVLELVLGTDAVMLNVDPKTDKAMPLLAESIRRHGAQDRLCVGSFSGRRLRRFRDEFGAAVATSLGPSEVTRLLRGATLRPGRRVRLPTGVVAAQVPVRAGRVPVVTRRMIDTAHASGIEVHVWTINEAPEMHRLLDLGVDGVMTDRPELLRAVLAERGGTPS
ncbi:glycerophosphodiester phosphodiesterase family protein [Nakamurella aerolata]|uniref:Glycerophosphodiester phosphodiesterase n=1 Tax=Nakamurella aerolata TaxID=1656892 RepID=A0A849AC49_9ACTN|nr:glycerophosphodiester phosphodiesterase [Nakamurella aerolata]